MSNEQLRADLEAAVALIPTPDTWCKDVLHDNGRMCAFGAVHTAIAGNWTFGAVYFASVDNEDIKRRVDDAKDALAAQVPADAPMHPSWLWAQNEDRVPGYNNHEDTTHADIVDLFNRAIKAAID